MKCGTQGFTLIELSIVLVIIGLIAGGVLVGQDLIKAAEIRGTVSQFEKYNAAMNTFRLKYTGLPGDINSGYATQFGMAARAGTAGQGDGNGLLEGSATSSSLPCGETVLVWRDLSFAGLIDGNFVGADGITTGPSCTAAASVAVIGTVLPPAKIGKGNFVTAYSTQGYNFYQLAKLTAITTAGAMTGVAVGLSPNESFQMDSKVDDGYPGTGSMAAVDVGYAVGAAPAAPAAAAPAAGVCISNALTPNPYNVTASTGGNTNACSVRFRFQ